MTRDALAELAREQARLDRAARQLIETSDDRVHVYPTTGRLHVTDGAPCWCSPVREEVPRADGTHGVVIVHREEN